MWAMIGNWIMRQIVMQALSWLAANLPAVIGKWMALARDYFAKRDRAVEQKKQIEETKEVLAVENDPQKRAESYVDALNSGRNK